MKEDVEKTHSVGMNEHLNKPIDVQKLHTTLLKYLGSKSVGEYNRQENLKKSNKSKINFPQFETIDTQYGLNLLMGNVKTYQIILKGLLKYKDINFDLYHGEELKRLAHTLKGNSEGAGALKVSKIAKELEMTLDKSLLPMLEKELGLVIDEIESRMKKKEE